MKRLAWLFLAVLCSAVLLNAEDKAETMSGWICDSKCVVQSAGRNTCDANCTERSGEAVFISDQGEVSGVSNQDVCSSHMGKHVKATATHVDQDKYQKYQKKAYQDFINIQELRDAGGIGG